MLWAQASRFEGIRTADARSAINLAGARGGGDRGFPIRKGREAGTHGSRQMHRILGLGSRGLRRISEIGNSLKGAAKPKASKSGPEVVKTKGGGRNATEFQSAIGCTSGTVLGQTNRHSDDYHHRFDLLSRRVCAK